MRNLAVCGFLHRLRVYPKRLPFLKVNGKFSADYLVGIWPAPDAATAGAGALPWIAAAPEAATSGADALLAARSSTLPELTERELLK